MKPFTLHSVLKYRRQLEDGARQHLFEALEAQAARQRQLGLADQELDELYALEMRSMETGVTPDRLALFEHRIDLIRKRRTTLQEELEKQTEQVRLRRRQLLAASKERRVMEKLRDNQNLAYQRHIDKKEAAMLDEIAVLFHKS
jgi:flagellar protein FliJ